MIRARLYFIAVALLAASPVFGASATAPDFLPADLYPPATQRAKSPGRTTYYVDPSKGGDSNSGLARDQAWRSFRPVNARFFAPGDRLEIVGPGRFEETLMPMGAGTAEAPVEIRFAPGRYDFFPTQAVKLKLHISNSNDDPDTPKAVAVLFREARHFRMVGNQADFYIHGKMIEVMFDHAEDIAVSGVSFDYHRPLVSEFTVAEAGANSAEVWIQRDCAYTIDGGRFQWVGEGWRSHGKGLNQECNPAEEWRCWRCGNSPLAGVTRAEELRPFNVRFHFEKNPGFRKGHIFQFREIRRDCAGGLIHRSRNITWSQCAFYALGGMGLVHQFSENLVYDHVLFAPRPGSGRTTCGWADLLHFSGCRGQILISDCKMSGSHDDPVNVHGTHLRIVGQPALDRIMVRFMHPQTYGLEAFVPGDVIEFVNHATLQAYATNRVKAVAAQGEKDVLLTLEAAAPGKMGDKDVIENVTWTPSVTVRRCEVSVDSCRGFLLTTRQTVLVESNTFIRTTMSAIDISDDANSWYESGPVRDVTIRGNRFIQCGEPVIRIAPEVRSGQGSAIVHRNIRILDNWFELAGQDAVMARNTKNLIVAGNRFSSTRLPVHTNACEDVKIEGNELGARIAAGRPQPGDADYPMPSLSARHGEKVTAVKSGDYDLVLIGDSITHTLGELGGKYEPLKQVWDRHFAPRRAINLGHNGYRTENILWNLLDGELDFPRSPKVAIVLIGTNNSDDRHFAKVHTAEEIFAGTRAIVDLIRRRHPSTKVLVLRIFPRGGDSEKGVSPPAFNSSPQCIEICRRAGELTARLADGQHVFWLDVNAVFLRSDGTINTDLMWDLLHPSPAGAEAWAQAVEPTLARLMGDQPIVGPPANTAPAPAARAP